MAKLRAPCSTRDRILLAADRLFAERGFGRTSMRALTREAGVNLAAVNYHFGSKLELLHGALARHVEAINRERLRQLEQLEANPVSVSIEAVLRALYRPAFEFSHGALENARATQLMLALLFREPPELVRPLVDAVFRETMERFVAALAPLLPGLPRDVLELRFQLGIGAMIHLLADLGPESPSQNPRGCTDGLVAFVAAALRGPT